MGDVSVCVGDDGDGVCDGGVESEGVKKISMDVCV